MRKTPVALVGLTLLALLLATAPARAAEPAAPPAARSVSAETGMGVLQFFAGAAVATGTLMVIPEFDDVFLISALVAPAAVGGTVCLVGNLSRRVSGSCWAPIGGAYIGALLGVPLALIFNGGRDNRSDAGLDDPLGGIGLAAGFAIGWVVLQPLISTFLWHGNTHPRPDLALQSTPPAPPPSERLRLVNPPQPHRPGAHAAGQLTLPLLAARF